MFISESKVLEVPAFAENLRLFLARIRKFLKETFCVLRNGKHELYKNVEPGKINQKCLLCQYETPGWSWELRKH